MPCLKRILPSLLTGPFLLIVACGTVGQTAPPVDPAPITAPTVSSTIPANASTGIAINLPISATFSRAMDPTTLSASTFYLRQGSILIPATVTHAGTTATLTPANALAPDAQLTATITVGVRDTSGRALAMPFSWTFTTGSDGQPLRVAGTRPRDGATDVLGSQPIGATFNERMDPSTLTSATFTVRQGSQPVLGLVTYDAESHTVVFTAATLLGSSLAYTATISTGAKSVTGRSLAAPHTWTFTTVAYRDRPVVSTTTPLDGARNVLTSQALTATFSERMDPTTLTAATFIVRQGSAAIAGVVSYDAPTRVATFRPTSALGASLVYTATISAGATSAAGTNLAAPYSWSFTTVIDSGAPLVSLTTPLNAASNVGLNPRVSAVFDQAMDPSTLTANTFTVRQGSASVAGTVSYQPASRTVTFLPATPLGAALQYTASLSTSVTSASGRALTAAHSWSFTTAPADAPPVISSTTPGDAALNVLASQRVRATFNQAMDASTLSTLGTFTLRAGANSVTGLVTYDAASHTATFAPAAPLGASTLYTATISVVAKSATGRNLAAPSSWTFTTSPAPSLAAPVNLRTAGNFVVLAKTQISTVPASAITGDIAVSPAAASYITGFSLALDGTTMFSTSPQVTGKVYAADYTSPTSTNLTTAISDMETAFTDAASRAPDITELAAGDISGMTLVPGVYKWSTGLLISADVYLSGSATDVWIFEIAEDLTVGSAVNVFLSGGARAKNVFWQVSGSTTIGTTSHFEGIILCQTAITMRTGASLNGRLLAQSAVVLDTNTVVAPAP